MAKTLLTMTAARKLPVKARAYGTPSGEPNLRLHTAPSGRKTWQLRVDGTMRRIGTFPDMTFEEAKVIARATRGTAGERQWQPPAPKKLARYCTVRQCLDAYLDNPLLKRRKCYRQSVYALNLVLRPIMDRPIAVLDDVFLVTRCDQMRPKFSALRPTFQRSSIKVYRGKVETFAKWLTKTGVLPRYPFVELPKLLTLRRSKAMHPDDEKRLLDWAYKAPKEQAAMASFIVLGLKAGLRRDEILSLERTDLELEDKDDLHVLVRAENAKGDIDGLTWIGPETARFLKARLRELPLMSPFHFPDPNGRFSKAVQAAGITRKVTPHNMRHSFASRLYRRTKDLEACSQQLRHRSISSTYIYIRSLVSEVKEVAVEREKFRLFEWQRRARYLD